MYFDFLGCFQIAELVISPLVKDKRGTVKPGEMVFSASALPAAAEQEENIRTASRPDHLVQRVSVVLWHSGVSRGVICKVVACLK